MKYFNGILSILLLVFFTSCGGDSASSGGASGDLREAKGGKYYGGVFKMNEAEYLRSMYPPNVTETGGHRISNQVYEGLLRFDQGDLTLKPSLAESWTVSDDGTVYTFKLRKGVRFHDDPAFPEGKGREVTAKDFKYCFDRWCAFDINNKGYDFIKDRIKGSVAYHKSTQNGVSPKGGCPGARVIDDYTFEVSLERPLGFFLNLLALPFSYVYPN